MLNLTKRFSKKMKVLETAILNLTEYCAKIWQTAMVNLTGYSSKKLKTLISAFHWSKKLVRRSPQCWKY